jgi:pyridoxal phosphate enzyme (YggS family)
MNNTGRIGENYAALLQKLQEATVSCGRDPSRIRVIAVSKTRSLGDVAAAMAAGLTDFGENRVQEARIKVEGVQPRPVWHLVGHLQTNKSHEAARLFDWVQSVDSVKVAAALGKAAREADKRIGVLVQVNTTGEEQKAGCLPAAVATVLEAVLDEPTLRLSGLMTIGPLSMEERATRRAFELCARLRDEWRSQLPPGAMAVVSMGMSGDWRWAVECGADWIRVGTAIFGERAA